GAAPGRPSQRRPGRACPRPSRPVAGLPKPPPRCPRWSRALGAPPPPRSVVGWPPCLVAARRAYHAPARPARSARARPHAPGPAVPAGRASAARPGRRSQKLIRTPTAGHTDPAMERLGQDLEVEQVLALMASATAQPAHDTANGAAHLL